MSGDLRECSNYPGQGFLRVPVQAAFTCMMHHHVEAQQALKILPHEQLGHRQGASVRHVAMPCAISIGPIRPPQATATSVLGLWVFDVLQMWPMVRPLHTITTITTAQTTMQTARRSNSFKRRSHQRFSYPVRAEHPANATTWCHVHIVPILLCVSPSLEKVDSLARCVRSLTRQRSQEAANGQILSSFFVKCLALCAHILGPGEKPTLRSGGREAHERGQGASAALAL